MTMTLHDNSKSFCVVLSLAILVIGGSASGIFLYADSSEVLTQDFLKNEEIVSGWYTLASAVENCSGIRVTRHEGMSGGPVIERKQEFKHKGSFVRSDIWQPKGESKLLQRHKTYCTNENYYFVLIWDEDTGKTAKIAEVNQQTSDLALNPVIRTEFDSGALAVMRGSYSMFGTPLWELLENEDFVVSNVKYVDLNRQIISFDFSYKLPAIWVPPLSGFDHTVRGYVEINTQKYGRIEKICSVAMHRKDNQQTFLYSDRYLEYSETEDGIPYATKLVGYRSKVGHGRKEVPVAIIEISDVDFTPAADQEFTLSAYGFPEPDFGERRANRFRYILMAIGSLMVIFALWQMYQKRKGQKV